MATVGVHSISKFFWSTGLATGNEIIIKPLFTIAIISTFQFRLTAGIGIHANR